ncbi:ER membrane protein complex subunit 10-like [Biomphalaria glabrata]|uniref:ER membrane protein complex subunit 10 n=1 Tax=Biomphalaria glabrata TaxID=6526 RepID=A0A9W3BJV7_BIOGL|nr:ER membrane protein complex subunit 10-like [Biomphalaria glabrata]
MASSMGFILGLSCSVYFYAVIVVGISTEDEFEGSRTLPIEHSFSSGTKDFTKHGTIIIQSLKGNKAQFTPGSILTSKEIELLRSAAKTNGLYRVRIPTKVSGDNTVYVSAATKACSILESGLEEEITINFDQSGEVLGVSVGTKIPACTGLDVPDANLTTWKTVVEIASTVSGPIPDTQTYIEKIKRDEQEKLKNQDGDNRSFLGKYWMYLVPLIIMMVIMSSADQQGQGGGGGR